MWATTVILYLCWIFTLKISWSQQSICAPLIILLAKLDRYPIFEHMACRLLLYEIEVVVQAQPHFEGTVKVFRLHFDYDRFSFCHILNVIIQDQRRELIKNGS